MLHAQAREISREVVFSSKNPLIRMNRKRCELLSDMVTNVIHEIITFKADLGTKQEHRKFISMQSKRRLKRNSGYGSIVMSVLVSILLKIIIKKLINRWWPELLESRG